MKTATDLQIRWLIRRDMDQVLRIEAQSFEFPWSEEDFLCCLWQRHVVGMVATRGLHEVVGFMIYELDRDQLRLLNFAVCPTVRRERVGTRMIERLTTKLAQQRRHMIFATVRETNLDALLFFRANGFFASDVFREHYEDTDEDAIEMRFDLPVEDV